jgi:hypothetical protein
MGKGYRIVDPELLYPFLYSGKYDDYAVAILHWLMQELRLELKDWLVSVEMEVIRTGTPQRGAYPVIGLTGDNSTHQLQQLAQETADRLLQERPITEIIKFIAESDTDWKTLTVKIMTINTLS